MNFFVILNLQRFDCSESTSCPSTGRDYNISQGSSNSSNNGLFDHNFILNDGSDGNPFDGNGGMDEKYEGGLKAEDFEIRMDLTDDLLHMVCSLNHFASILVTKISHIVPLC